MKFPWISALILLALVAAFIWATKATGVDPVCLTTRAPQSGCGGLD